MKFLASFFLSFCLFSCALKPIKLQEIRVDKKALSKIEIIDERRDDATKFYHKNSILNLGDENYNQDIIEFLRKKIVMKLPENSGRHKIKITIFKCSISKLHKDNKNSASCIAKGKISGKNFFFKTSVQYKPSYFSLSIDRDKKTKKAIENMIDKISFSISELL